MGNRDRSSDNAPGKRQHEPHDTPGSAGYPEPGSGHDDSKTTTVKEGPPIRKTDGEPGAFGEAETDRQPTHPEEPARDIE